MYAVEFETEINNGIVEIPLQYSEIREINDSVKVIILTDIEKNHRKTTINKSVFDNFLSLSKQVDFFNKFDRDELHDR